jgi:hypothetical protein
LAINGYDEVTSFFLPVSFLIAKKNCRQVGKVFGLGSEEQTNQTNSDEDESQLC